MEKSKKEKPGIEKAGEDLFNFAINREDLKLIMSLLPEEAYIKRETVEYELQILKFISTGWGITYFLENSTHKDRLTELYWKAVYQYSQNISETTYLMIGQKIEYFQILKQRLEMYLEAMKEQPNAPEPAVIMGPEFARTCGNVEDVFTIMAGSRMFKSTVGSVKNYFEK
ncbi:MAG: hypothetical protein KKA35_03775, partial [Proteobacteria bacterium]|nr:hypothetical protein [Pseudomonadota bacterium]